MGVSGDFFAAGLPGLAHELVGWHQVCSLWLGRFHLQHLGLSLPIVDIVDGLLIWWLRSLTPLSVYPIDV